MALALSKPKSVTPAQYLALEEMATNKSEYFHKGEDGRWVLTEFKLLTDQLRIISIDLALSLDRIYERVEWESTRNEPN